MPKLTQLIRDAERVTAFLRDGDQFFCQYYPKTMTNEQIRAAIAGKPIPPTPEPITPPDATGKKVQTIPTPSPVHRHRVSRDTMIAELAKAKIKVDTNDPVKLKAAYRAMLARNEGATEQ